MKLYIRTEANAITAGGHMMRCLAIAAGARNLGEECVFITAEKASAVLPKEWGFETIVLDRDFKDFDGEIPVMKELIAECGIRRLLVDSYYVTPGYMSELNGKTAVAYIDDLHERIWDCSFIINYSVYSDDWDYEKEYGNAVKILGCDYVPLRDIYRDLPAKEIRDDAKKILVLSGAADPEHFLLKLAGHVKNADDGFEYTMISGRFNSDLKELESIAAGSGNIRLLGSQPDLRSVLSDTDIAITAGGTTMYEMAATGTPGISYTSADNQLGNARGFDRRSLIPYAGSLKADFSFEKLDAMCRDMMNDAGRRRKISASLQKLADGHGAERIAGILTGESR